MINAYHVHVRCKKSEDIARHVKMSLQLYQVDYKSFLLDFKSLPLDDGTGSNSNPELNNSNSELSIIPCLLD